MQVIIQHHPKRKRHLELITEFINDRVFVVEDTQNSAKGMVKCFNAIRDDYALILQDDILPSKDLVKTAQKLISLFPDNIISLFSANSIITKAIERKKHFVAIDKIYGLCAYIIPRFLAEQYLKFDPLIKDRIFADDVRLSMFLKHNDDRAILTAPSLVEHLGFYDCVQKRENNGRVLKQNIVDYRIAEWFIGFEESGLDINWDKDKIITHTIGQKYDFIRHYKKSKSL